MLTLAIFIVSLVLLALLFIMKGFEICNGRKICLERQFENLDIRIHNILLKLRYWWSHVNFKNSRRFLLWLIVNTHKFIVAVKRRFDHKQSHFFTKRESHPSRNINSVSFFLKDISEYKKSLREGSGEKK